MLLAPVDRAPTHLLSPASTTNCPWGLQKMVFACCLSNISARKASTCEGTVSVPLQLRECHRGGLAKTKSPHNSDTNPLITLGGLLQNNSPIQLHKKSGCMLKGGGCWLLHKYGGYYFQLDMQLDKDLRDLTSNITRANQLKSPFQCAHRTSSVRSSQHPTLRELTKQMTPQVTPCLNLQDSQPVINLQTGH